MNNWTAAEVAFRCDRLSVRLERLAQNFSQLAALSLDGNNAEAALAIVRESKVFLELTAIDLEVDNAFELAQMQRQLSRWHLRWVALWADDAARLEISTSSQTWVKRVRAMAGVLV